MNDFNTGFTIGRFFVSWVVNDLFFGFSIQLGKQCEDEIYHLTIQLGYGMVCIGFDKGEE